jgi:hypothetical protein
MKTFTKFVAACAAVSLVAGCASSDNLRLLREPEMPPIAVAKASHAGPYYHNIAIQEVHGAPEFRFLDGNGIINTRPTRKHMLSILAEDLDNADMLAPSRLDAAYMLYVEVEQLKGPDVVPLSDKLSSARVTFRLVNWRTGAVARQMTEEANFVARSPGITPEAARFATAEALGLAVDAFAINASVRAGTTGTRGLTDLEAALAGGAYGGVKGLLWAGEQQPAGALKGGYFDGTLRREYATNEVIHLLLDQFLHDVSKEDGTIVFKQAVSCRYLNGEKFADPVTETANAFGIDCPGVHYTSDRLKEVGPSHFS